MARAYKELSIVDNFMFCKVFGTDPELSRHLLELLLGKKIKKVCMQTYEKVIDVTPDGKSIRMDVFLDDEEGTVYDLEMQTTNQRNLAKRVRYYQGIIDLNQLEKGTDYDSLPKSIILFICTFDYFGKGLPFYTFTYRCKEDPKLELGDDTSKVFVNLTGASKVVDSETGALYRYFMGQQASDQYTEQLSQAVARARWNTEWEVEYMRWRAYEMDMESDKRHAREEGLAEGRAEGREIGLAEGREEGRAEGRELGLAEGREAGLAEGRAEGREAGLAEGRAEGKTEGLIEGGEMMSNRLNKLYTKLLELNRTEDMKKAFGDDAFRELLLQEFDL